MEINVFLDGLKEILDLAKEKNVKVAKVDVVADNYYDCLQFSDERGNLLAEIDFTGGVIPIFYGALIK